MRDGWQKVNLRDLLSQIHRPVEVGSLSEVPFAGVRWYGEGVYARPVEPAGKVKTKTLDRLAAGDVTYNRMWATKASFGIAGPDVDGCLVTNDFPIFAVDADRMMVEFIGLVFHARTFQEAAASSATGTTERKRLKERDFLRLNIDLPPLAEQRRIVDLIGALDETIERANERRQAALSLYASSIIVPPVESCEMQVRDLVKRSQSGGTPSRKVEDNFGGTIPWVKSGEVENDALTDSTEHITEAGLQSSSAWLVPAGATLVAMYGQGDTKGRAGYVASPVSTNQAVIALVPNPEVVLPRFLFHSMRGRTSSLRQKAVGAAQPNLSKAIIDAETIFVPPLNQQVRLVGYWDSCLDEADILSGYIRGLRALRSELLTALLSGAHEIPESYDETIGVELVGAMA